MQKKQLLQIIHDVFVKYDIIGVIADGGQIDEYQMEESKLGFYILNNPKTNTVAIYKELVFIIEDWFGTKNLDVTLLNNLNKMSSEIFDGMSKVSK